MSKSEIILRAMFEFDCKTKDYTKFNNTLDRIYKTASEKIYPIVGEKGFSGDNYKK